MVSLKILINGKLIRNASKGSAKILAVEADVTGGMMRKVMEAKKISSMGTECIFCEW